MLPLFQPLNAQTPSSLEVQGQINDGTSPIPGATVLIKGEQRGTVSDFNGHFKITAQSTDTLVISYIGYAIVEEPVNNRTTINITMQDDATTLREIVINAGYYTVRDKERTGSISRVPAKEIENQPVNNPLEALQGRMSGVHIVQNSGVPGGGYEVRIRGQNSIMAGNAPLYIIDGVPFDEGTMGYLGLSGAILPNANISPLNAIHPSMIESIEVLKDADATAIYGSRGSNGVVLITTKRGRSGATEVTVDASSGLTYTTKSMELMNTEQYLEMRREAFANDGLIDFPENAYDVNGTWDPTRETDWQQLFLENTAMMHQLRTTISGGNERNRMLLGGTAQKEEAVLYGNFNYKRVTAFSNLSHRSDNELLKVNFSANYAIENNRLPATDLVRASRTLQPNAPELFDSEGNLNWEDNTWNNPLAELESRYKNQSKSLVANTVISYQIANKLEGKVNLGYTVTDLEETRTNPHTMFNPAFGLTSAISNSQTNQSKRHSWIVEPQLDYSNTFGKSKLKLSLGSTFQERQSEQNVILASGFSSNNLINNWSAANQLFVLNESNTQYRYHAVYGRLNYILNETYILNLTGRRDGSSRFGAANRYANFGAVGAAWLFGQENFVSNSLPWLSYGKVRASYGTTGNDQIGDYQYLNTFEVSDLNYNGTIGLIPSRLWNPYFAWEKNRKIEAAMELGFLKDRINLTVGYFYNKSDNQLVGVPLPGTTGFTSIRSNLDAVVVNKGWELNVNSTLVKQGAFGWETAFNITLPQNELVAFEGLESSPYANQFVIGQPVSILKLYKFTGVDSETGLFTFEDFNDDGAISAPDDRQYVVNLAPTMYGGFSNQITYKNWHFNFLFQFVKQMAPNYFYGSPPAGTMFNQPVEILDRWQQPGDQASFQRFTTGMNPEAAIAYTNFTQSDAAVTDASFIRLKNIALDYTIPKTWLSHTSVKVYIQGQNLLTITKFKGGDPEQRSGFLPPLKRVNIGTTITF